MKVCTEDQYQQAFERESDGLSGFRCLDCLSNYATQEEAKQCTRAIPLEPKYLRRHRDYVKRKLAETILRTRMSNAVEEVEKAMTSERADDDDKPSGIIPFERWIEVGSPEWQQEVMSAINELIDRVMYLEEQQGVRYDRGKHDYVPVGESP